MKSFTMIVASVFLICTYVAYNAIGMPEQAFTGPPEGDFSLMWSDDLALLTANDAPVNVVLTAISRASGIEIELDPRNEAGVTLDMFIDTKDVDDLERLIMAVNPSSVITFEQVPRTREYRIAHIKTMAMVGGPVIGSSLRDEVVRNNRLYELAARMSPAPADYVGIGAQLSYAEERQSVWVMPLTSDAPVSVAGIRMGDVVIAINNRPISEFGNIREITQALRGEEHEAVSFRIRDPGGRISDRTVVRRRVRYPGPAHLQEQASR
jgi:hypothetical protein